MPTVKSVRLSEDITMPYVERGELGRTPLVLIPGYADSWRSFELVLEHLPASVHAFAITQRGHGDAGKPASGYQTQDFVSDLVQFIERMGLEHCVLVGGSSGGLVARTLAIDFPERVAGLVLAGSPFRPRENAAIRAAFDSTISTLVDPVSEDFVREFQLGTVAQPVPSQFLRTIVEEALRVPARVWREALQGLLADHSDLELARIQCPSLVLWGDADALLDRTDQEQLARAIPGARLKVYAGAGHALYWEEPERVAADLAAFVGQIGEGAPGP